MRMLNDHYETKRLLNRGAWSEIHMGNCKKNKKPVSLQKVMKDLSQPDLPISAIREIELLKQLTHPNIAELFEVCEQQRGPFRNYFLVTEFCPLNLAELINDPKFEMRDSDRKTILKHILYGLYELHRMEHMHRDISPDNILISKEGVVKLSDFRVVKRFASPRCARDRPPHCAAVTKLPYRAPELLLGETMYTEEIDMWSLGCILPELWLREPLFKVIWEREQLFAISELCGSINAFTMPNCECLPNWMAYTYDDEGRKAVLPMLKSRKIKTQFSPFLLEHSLLELLDSLLSLNPRKRPSAREALSCEWLRNAPCTVRDLLDSY